MLGILEKDQIEDLLGSQMLGRIGCHADDITYIVPISYAYDGTFIYAHSDEGMKTSIMRKNPKVCFQVDHMKDMVNWRSVITWGVFEELTDPEQRNEAIRRLANRVLPLVSSEKTHLSKHWPFPDEDLSDIRGVILRIRLTEKTGRFENNDVSAFFRRD